MKKTTLLIAAAMGVASCQPPTWNKPGASLSDFNNDRFQCMQSSQQQESTASTSRYGGYAVSQQTTNTPLFAACMYARGWTLGQQNSGDQAAQKSEVDTAVKANAERERSICADAKFAPYYSKTACLATEITFEQLADTAKISPAAKAIFIELRSSVDAAVREYLDFQRRSGGTAGAKRSDIYLSTTKPQNDKNNLDLYNGAITWGEYNRRRQSITNEYLVAAGIPLQTATSQMAASAPQQTSPTLPASSSQTVNTGSSESLDGTWLIEMQPTVKNFSNQCPSTYNSSVVFKNRVAQGDWGKLRMTKDGDVSGWVLIGRGTSDRVVDLSGHMEGTGVTGTLSRTCGGSFVMRRA